MHLLLEVIYQQYIATGPIEMDTNPVQSFPGFLDLYTQQEQIQQVLSTIRELNEYHPLFVS